MEVVLAAAQQLIQDGDCRGEGWASSVESGMRMSKDKLIEAAMVDAGFVGNFAKDGSGLYTLWATMLGLTLALKQACPSVCAPNETSNAKIAQMEGSLWTTQVARHSLASRRKNRARTCYMYNSSKQKMPVFVRRPRSPVQLWRAWVQVKSNPCRHRPWTTVLPVLSVLPVLRTWLGVVPLHAVAATAAVPASSAMGGRSLQAAHRGDLRGVGRAMKSVALRSGLAEQDAQRG